MKNNVFLFTGENTYALTRELRRWKEVFREKHGEANLQILDGREVRLPDLLDEVRVAPFAAKSRLVLVEGIPPALDRDALALVLRGVHPATVLAFCEATPDKRKSTVKMLQKEATVKTFKPLTKRELVQWVTKSAEEHGALLSPDTAGHLIDTVGTDQWHLGNELLKLIAFTAPSDHPTIRPSIADIDAVCLPSEKQTVWILSDLIGGGKAGEAVTFSRALIEGGEDAMRLWNLYLWIVNNLATLWFHLQSTIDNRQPTIPKESLSKESGVPFPSTRSLLPLAQTIDRERLMRIVGSSAAADEAVKTGTVRASSENPIELVTLLERELLRH